MREGSLEAPVRHPINWNDPDMVDQEKIDLEMRRVFDVCHGCRRCFNLCDSFPRLFDLIDESESGELDSVSSADFKNVVDACTLCDMCFMVSCPYVPPHEFNIDFPHLMLRHRVAELKAGKVPAIRRELTKTDRNGKLASFMPGLANWASDRSNKMTRLILESVAGVHRDASLPRYHGKTFGLRTESEPVAVNTDAPAYGRKVVLYSTCFVNYNNPEVGMATRAVLARNGVETHVLYPVCCGMPQFEQGNLDKVAESARHVATKLQPWVDSGHDVIALTPSCALMLKFEWMLLLPEDEDIKRLSQATYDISEYIVDIAKKEGLADGLRPLPGGIALHIACHARAQNVGQKAVEMMRLVPDVDLQVIARCSGHGGSWGVMKENFEVALKVGRPVARQTASSGKSFVASECPLAGEHIIQGMEGLNGENNRTERSRSFHPIELFAHAYGIHV